MVVSEASLLTADPPAEAAAFWQTEYPRISSVDENCGIIADTGYFCLKTITLPRSAWDEFYAPQVELIRRLREGPLTRKEEEIRIQNRYPDAYGYVFYVMQRPAR